MESALQWRIPLSRNVLGDVGRRVDGWARSHSVDVRRHWHNLSGRQLGNMSLKP